MDWRQYDMAIGRFVSVDMVTHFSESPYCFAGNNPIIFNDPSGLDYASDWANNQVYNILSTGSSSNWGQSAVGGDALGFIEGLNSSTYSTSNPDTISGLIGHYAGLNGYKYYTYTASGSTMPDGQGLMFYKTGGSGIDGFFRGAVNSAIDDYISSFVVFDLIEKSGYELIPRMAVSDSQQNYAMAGGLALALLTPGPGGEGKAALKYSDDLLKVAQDAYPKLAGKFQLYHITPKYLGGLVNGALIKLDAAYHQMITNEFRRLYGYGQGIIKDPAARQKIVDEVYSVFPLPK